MYFNGFIFAAQRPRVYNDYYERRKKFGRAPLDDGCLAFFMGILSPGIGVYYRDTAAGLRREIIDWSLQILFGLTAAAVSLRF